MCIESGNGTVTVSSGTVVAENTGSGTAFARGIKSKGDVTVDGNAKITAVNTGTFATGIGVSGNNFAVEVSEEAQITAEGAVTDGTTDAIRTSGSNVAVKVSDGKFTGAIGDASKAEKPVKVTGNRITGGIFTNDPSAYLNPKFKAVYDSAENVYKIVKRPVVEEQYAPAVKVEAVDVSSLNEAQQTALADLTANGTQELVNVVKASLEGAVENSDGSYTVIIKAELLKGNATSTVHVWFVNEDGTLMEVGFTVDEYGNIVILSGSLGIYFVTLDNTVVETVEKA